MRTTATSVVFVGVSRTPQHPKDAKRKEMTIVRPAKGAMRASGVMPKTTTSRPAAVTAKRRMPPQRYELRYHGTLTYAGPCARLRQSMPSADAKVPTSIRKTPRPQSGDVCVSSCSCMTKAWTRSGGVRIERTCCGGASIASVGCCCGSGCESARESSAGAAAAAGMRCSLSDSARLEKEYCEVTVEVEEEASAGCILAAFLLRATERATIFSKCADPN